MALPPRAREVLSARESFFSAGLVSYLPLYKSFPARLAGLSVGDSAGIARPLFNDMLPRR